MFDETNRDHWTEETSKSFFNYGRYFIPQREAQMRLIVDFLDGLPQPCTILDLCCGEGLLAEMILQELPGADINCLDGSQVMLDQANERLAGFRGRYRLGKFELADRSWRRLTMPVQAVVSMLAIHHLDGDGKQILFKDMYGMLCTRGVFIIADITDPTSQPGREVAARAWDDHVRQRSLELDGKSEAFEFFQREGWNTYRFSDPEDIDPPSLLFCQLKWLEQAGFTNIDIHLFQAGHALFSGWKSA